MLKSRSRVAVGCFDTDNGIRRATTQIIVFETNRLLRCFDTDNGIRRATTKERNVSAGSRVLVSIPITVLGGLQHGGDPRYRGLGSVVSILITVLGGLQRPDPERSRCDPLVSIPITVLGGLQPDFCRCWCRRNDLRFDTDNGIRRATTFFEENKALRQFSGFDTDNGIRRATTGRRASGRGSC